MPSSDVTVEYTARLWLFRSCALYTQCLYARYAQFDTLLPLFTLTNI